MYATVLVAARANQVDTRAKKLVLVKLSWYFVSNAASNLIVQTVEFDANASSIIVWDLSEGISVLYVVVRQ